MYLILKIISKGIFFGFFHNLFFSCKKFGVLFFKNIL